MYNLIYIILTEIIMTPLIIWILDYSLSLSKKMSFLSHSISLIILVMMASMLDALFYYFVTYKNLVDAVIAINIAMDTTTVALLYILVRYIRHTTAKYDRKLMINGSILLTWNEISMALFLFALSQNYIFKSINYIKYISFFGSSITYILFLIPMVTEMIFFIVIKLKLFNRFAGILLLLMQVSDPAMFHGFIEFPLIISYSIIMFIVLYLLVVYIFRNRKNLSPGNKRLISWIFVLIAVSAAGIIEPFIISKPFGLSWLLMAFSMVISMLLYFEIVFGLFD